MFNVFSRARTRDQSIRQALAQAGLPAATDRARVVLVRKPGQYSGRRVDFFHVFDPNESARSANTRLNRSSSAR